MAKRILKTLSNNFGFKILAVLFAFVLWLIVYNIDDPTKTRTFTTNVTIENKDIISESNKYFEILDGTNTVTFVVTAKRSTLDKLEDSDFTAVADMSRLVLAEDGTTGSVPIEIDCYRTSESLKYNSTKYLKVALEDLMSKQFVISANVTGKVLEGYALGEVSVASPTVLKVSGPASLVEQIESVVATIDVDGMSMNLTDNVVPVLYNANGEEIDTTKLQLSNYTVSVSAKILGTKEIPLNFSTRGTPGENSTVLSVTSDPQVIRIKGTSSALNSITSVVVPNSVLDVSGLTSSLTTTVDITEYLPEGIELVDNSEATVSVTVTIENYETKNYSVLPSNVTINGLDGGYSVDYPSGIVVTIGGMSSDLGDLNAPDLKGSIDVSGLAEGTHTVYIKLELDAEKYSLTSSAIEVVLTKKNDQTNNNGEASNMPQ